MVEPNARTRAGIFLTSAATLCLELSLTRYFSISQDYHFAFLVISIAFLGYGASGSFLALFRNLQKYDREKFLSISSTLYGFSVLLCFFLANHLPFDFFNLLWDKDQAFLILVFYLVLCIPFFFAGLTVSFAVTRMARSVASLYFFDLFGAGVGSVLAVIIFLPAGERGVFVLISSLALLAALFFCPRRARILRALLLLFLTGETALFLLSPPWLAFRISPFKALPVALKYPGAKSLFTRWNAISRVDALESPAVRYAPGLSLLYGENLPPQTGLCNDAGELTAITNFHSLEEPDLRFLSWLPSSAAYGLVQNPRALILDPKGGIDVLSALYYRSARVKVIESNPLLPGLLRRDLAAASGQIYNRPDIEVGVSDCRAALKQEKEEYDLIVFPLNDIFGSSETGLYGFGENHLLTVESFVQVLERLSPAGMASVSLYLLPPPRQEIRMLAGWIEALERTGRDPGSHILALRSWGTISYFIKKSPLSGQDIQSFKAFARDRLFDLVYCPGVKAEETDLFNQLGQPLYYDISKQLLSPSQRKAFYESYLFDVRPVSDNRPFFHNFFKPDRLKAAYEAVGNKWLPFLQGELIVPLIFGQAVVIAGLMIIGPLFRLRKKVFEKRPKMFSVCNYFGLIGAAFIFVELALLQKFILFLGHPLYSAATIIFGLLVSAGAGSFWSRKLALARPRSVLIKSLLICAVALWAAASFYPSLLNAWMGLPLVSKVFLSLGLVFPVGFLMGVPFPTAIRLVNARSQALVPWAWAANSFSSVINSVLALGIAFRGGYTLVLALAGGGYLLACLFLGFADHGHESHG